MMDEASRLPIAPPFELEGADNTRELGGYPVKGGGRTLTHRILRSDALCGLTPRDKAFLHDYGVRCIIDLRTERECRVQPEDFSAYEDVRCYRFPMSDQLHADVETGELKSLGELYVHLMDHAQQSIRGVMRTVAAEPGCVLFHCAAGKDRTGIIAMLLLLLAGVPEDVVVADYRVSEENMIRKFYRQKIVSWAFSKPIQRNQYTSDPEDIHVALRRLREYGGVEEYLRKIGVSWLELAAIRDKLTK